MKRPLRLRAIGLALVAGGTGPALGCIDEGYDALNGGSKRAIAQPELNVALTADPERTERRCVDDPARAPLATSR